MTEKKSKYLYKSTTNRSLTGAIGGLGEYFEIDPTLLRVSFVIVTAFSGFMPGIICYLVMSLVIPNK
ncbi:MAG: PspC domain-containing protein [Microgenomates group bacterium]